MSKINKLITNKPVTLTEEEVTNLSKTLSAVQTAGGGGGGGGRVYYGDNSTISVNQIDGIISLTTDATEKLNTPIPTKVSDLIGYEDYQTVDKMSAYLTTAQYNSDSAKFATKTELETTAATFEGLIQSYVQGLASEAWVTAQGYLTKPSGDLYYTPLPAGLSDDQYYAMTNSGWKVIQGGGGQGGISTVAHDSSLTGNGNSENLGIKTDAALNLTNASAYSAQKAEIAFNYWDPTSGPTGAPLNIAETFTNYLTTAQYETDSATFVTSSTTAITGTKQYALTTAGWAEVQAGSTFTGVTTTGSISGGGVNNDTIGLLTSAENALATIGNKVDKPDTTQESLNNKYLVYSTLSGTGAVTGWTDFNANVYSKSESDGRYQKKEDMGSYLTTAQYETDSAKYVLTGNILTAANNTLTGIKIGSTSYAVPTTDLSNYYTKSETSATGELNTEFAKKLDKTTYATDSATFVTSSNSTITGTKQYALTTTGWASVETAYLPTSGGTVSGSTYFSAANGQNMLAVASAATLIGASRQTSAHFGQDTNALGTTWIGVGGPGMYRGFLKYTQGGNVGDLDSNNTMQVEFTPNNKGTIFARAKNSGNDCPETQILNPTKASCDAMVQSANANLISGPNYMLAKNADGQFVIGAACINCTAISDVTLAPNTYYFVYEV